MRGVSGLRRQAQPQSGSVLARGLSYNANIDSSKLEVVKSEALKAKTPEDDLVFGATFTDHMLEIDWNEKVSHAS